MSDDRPTITVSTDHNPDETRAFYEIPEALANRVQPVGTDKTFCQCLADLLVRLDDAIEVLTFLWVNTEDEGISDEAHQALKRIKGEQ